MSPAEVGFAGAIGGILGLLSVSIAPRVWSRFRPIAVMTREGVQRAGRQQGELERTYLSIFDTFAQMIAEGLFPYPARGGDAAAAPRVGDGVMSLDGEGRVTYLSPNANSALHRVGIHANAVGMRLRQIQRIVG